MGYSAPSSTVNNQSVLREPTQPTPVPNTPIPTVEGAGGMLNLEDKLGILRNLSSAITGKPNDGPSTGKIIGGAIARPIQQVQKVVDTVKGWGKNSSPETRESTYLKNTLSSKTGGGDSMMGRLLSVFTPPTQSAN